MAREPAFGGTRVHCSRLTFRDTANSSPGGLPRIHLRPSDPDMLDERQNRDMTDTAAHHDSAAVRCSFCGKSQKQVKKIIAGPENVFICDECVDLCVDILEEEVPESPAVNDKSGPLSPQDVKRLSNLIHDMHTMARNCCQTEDSGLRPHLLERYERAYNEATSMLPSRGRRSRK